MNLQNGAKQTMNVMPAPPRMNHNFRPGQNEAKGGAFEPVNMSSHVVSTFASNVAGAEDILDEEGGKDGEVIDTVTDRTEVQKQYAQRIEMNSLKLSPVANVQEKFPDSGNTSAILEIKEQKSRDSGGFTQSTAKSVTQKLL